MVVEDLTAFSARYPAFTGSIAGVYDGRLSNSGETLELVDAVGRPIRAADDPRAAAYEAAGGNEYLTLRLGFSKALSARFTEAVGEAEFDIASGAVSIAVTGLPEADALEAWLIDNQPGPRRSVLVSRAAQVR